MPGLRGLRAYEAEFEEAGEGDELMPRAPEKAKAYSRAYREKNSEKINAQWRVRRKNNADKINARKREYGKKNPEKIREKNRRYREKHGSGYSTIAYRAKKYGVAPEAVRAQLLLQDNKCANPKCRAPFTSTKHTHLDHDHVSGALRGFLCQKCNLWLGSFNDDPVRLRGAATYLEQGGYWGRTPPPAPAVETAAYPLTYAWVEDE